jgi:lipoprotein-anchoring transpeptidase ErfK/SrfK
VHRPRLALATIGTALALLAVGCGGGGGGGDGHGGGGPPRPSVRLSIAPAGGSVDSTPNKGITVTAARGRLTRVIARSGGHRVAGKFARGHTVWHSTWALNVSQKYSVTATAAGASGGPLTRTSSFRTFTPRKTFDVQIVEGAGQTYGVGMPIILYFNRPVTNKKAVERSLELRSSKRVVGGWYWDDQCRVGTLCLYFRPRHYWPAHTRVSFTGHFDGLEAAPGVYGHHTLAQSWSIGSPLITKVNTAGHYMEVFRDGKLFAHWPISSGKPGDDTPDGNYLTIEKANPVQMTGPGYSISVPYSVRITWSGDYLHDAFWSVGAQGFSNVSHGCVNMSPEHARIFYGMAVPGDPVKITGSPRAGTWDNGWTMWFLSWKKWKRGSALHKAVVAGRHGSRFVSK